MECNKKGGNVHMLKSSHTVKYTKEEIIMKIIKYLELKDSLYSIYWDTLKFLVVGQKRIIETFLLHNTFMCSKNILKIK